MFVLLKTFKEKTYSHQFFPFINRKIYLYPHISHSNLVLIMRKLFVYSLVTLIAAGGVLQSCKLKKAGHIAVDDDAAKQVYVAPDTKL